MNFMPICWSVYRDRHFKGLNFLLLVKEHNSDKKSEADSDCAEQDVGCWSQKWSARYEYLHCETQHFHSGVESVVRTLPITCLCYIMLLMPVLMFI